ncbi:protein boule-like protein, partial [Dinothrombium tinctorium]
QSSGNRPAKGTNLVERSSTSPSPASMTTVNVPRFGTTVPNRIFVGGISTDTSEPELQSLFVQFGNVKQVKIISDRAGVPKGYGFVTFETDEEAKRVLSEGDNLTLKGRKLNVAIAVKKQLIGRPLDTAQYIPNGTILYPQNSIPFPAYDTTGHFTFSTDGLYPFTSGPSPGSMPTTYPFIYHQHPIFVAQPQGATLSSYPSTHFQAGATNTTGTFPGTHFQTSNSAATHWAAAAALSANTGHWQWPPAGGECVSFVNVNSVALNK